MSWLPFLNLIESFLSKSSKRQLFALYGTFFSLFFAFIYHFCELELFFKSTSKQEIVLKPNAINKFDFMNDLDSFLNKHHITLTQFHEQNNTNYTLQATGRINALLLLMSFIEHYQSINIFKTIKLQEDHQKLHHIITLEFSFNPFLYDISSYGELKKNLLSLPFTNAATALNSDSTSTNNNAIALTAIVNEMALINNQWYSKNQRVNDLILRHIALDEVLFENSLNEKIIIKLRP